MGELVVLAILIGVLIGWLLIIWLCGHIAHRNGWTGKKRFRAYLVGFLIVFIPLFGEDIPTLIGFGYFATFKAGFEVYQTKEQWLKDNPGQEAQLAAEEGESIEKPSIKPRFYILSNDFNNHGFPLNYDEYILMDRQTNKSLAKYSVVYSGYTGNPFNGGNWRAFKAWLNLQCCENDRENYLQFKAQFIKPTPINQ